MYPIVNNKPTLLPYDLCYIKGTKEIVLITEVNLNTSQTKDVHQWSFAVEPITPGNTKCAWFYMEELVKIKNVFEVIAERSVHPMSSGSYEFSLDTLRRKDK